MTTRSTSHRRCSNRSSAAALLLSFVTALYAGCQNRPCETTRQCGSSEVCAASLCQELRCGQTLFLKDPQTGRCTPLAACFLGDEQRDWVSCADADPCSDLAEAACLADRRCQPHYALDSDEDVARLVSICRAGGAGLPNGAGLAGQAQELHPPITCTLSTPRNYTGCRLVPELPAPCSALEETECVTRTDCQWQADAGRGASGAPACVDRLPLRTADCTAGSMIFAGLPDLLDDLRAYEVACLTNPRCQPTGARCYCPAGARCSCSGGEFIACEHNDRLVRCSRDADCAAGQSCRMSRDCPTARSGVVTGSTTSQPCLGVCAVGVCGGLDESTCSARADCTAVYATECSSSVSRYYQQCPLNPAGSTVDGCLCDNVFQRCADVVPIVEQGVTVRPERSLLIRDPEIVEDAAFRLDNVLAAFAKPGDEDAILERWFERFTVAQTLPNGAAAVGRNQVGKLLAQQTGGVRKWLREEWHTSALINRLDLLAPGTCGEARIAFAYNGGYQGSSNRMTLIIELTVPDDGHGCKQAAAQWLELSAIDAPELRLLRLKALYGALLRPEHLGQVRTNEFLNPSRSDPWELREWHLVDGDLVLAPARQAVDRRHSGTSQLERWVHSNLAALAAGTAVVPDSLLAAAVAADGRMLRVPGSRSDAALRQGEAAVNKLGCAGCHLESTGTPFVHIGERLAEPRERKPRGRAVVSEFLLNQLPERAEALRAVWLGTASLQAMRRSASLRVH